MNDEATVRLEVFKILLQTQHDRSADEYVEEMLRVSRAILNGTDPKSVPVEPTAPGTALAADPPSSGG